MKFPSYKTLLISIGILFLIGVGLLIFIFVKSKSSVSSIITQNNAVDLSNKKVSIDINKISDTQTQNYVKNAGNISVTLTAFTHDPTRFPIEFNTPNGNYEYNITFTPDGFNILFAPDSQLFENKNLINVLISNLIISSSKQKFEKNLSHGDLFDKQTREDSINYSNAVLSNDSLNKLSIVSIN